jgi:hypothetical protein
MSLVRTGAAVVVLGLVATFLGAQPALAARWDGTDALGDGPLPVDISHVTVWNSSENLTTKIRFHDLVRSQVGGVNVIIDTGKRFGEAYELSLRWRPHVDHFSRSLYRLPDLGSAASTRIACSGIAVDWRARREFRVESVRVVLPQRCLGEDAGTVRLFAQAFVRGQDAGGDSVPELGSKQAQKQLIKRG